jgi:hypothetical protein
MLEGEVELVCILFIFKNFKDIVPLSSTKTTPHCPRVPRLLFSFLSFSKKFKKKFGYFVGNASCLDSFLISKSDYLRLHA